MYLVGGTGKNPGTLTAVHPAVMALAALGCLLPASQADAWTGAQPGPKAPQGKARSPERSRTVRIEKVEIRGREQVSTAQIVHVLEDEGLVEGADLIIPEDSRVDRARERLRATGYFRLVNIGFRPIAGRRDSAVLIVELEERSSIQVSDVYLGTGSPCIDAGTPDAAYNDGCLPPGQGAERNDMGAYGGPDNCGWPGSVPAP